MSFTSELRSPYELRQTIRQLARLVEISVVINSTLEIDRLLQYIIEAAADLLNCEAASILLYDEQEDSLFFAAATGSDPLELAKIPVPIEGSIAGKIFSENTPYLLNDLSHAPEHYNRVGQQVDFAAHSLLGVPMRIRNKVIGVLEALNKREGEFNGNDLRLLSVTASHASVAIENARLVQALQRANEELREANRLKSDFIAIASHELRTPLGVILGYASFLKEDAQGELSEHAEMVLNSALRLRALVEDMTNLSMLQKGEIVLHLEVFPAQRVVMDAYQESVSAAETKSQSLKLHIPKNDVLIRADYTKMRLVLSNLINNAIRFTPSGGRVDVRLSGTKRRVGIEVRDTGPGIPPDKLENIFREFYQVEDHLTRRTGGMGLGLAITKGIVEAHGGRIWAENRTEGHGAVFKILLPRATTRLTPRRSDAPNG